MQKQKNIHVVIDRPLGSVHPKHPNIVYEVNYGYIPNTVAGDGEEQDVYVLGVDHAIEEFDGVLIAVIVREDDVEEKWVAAPPNTKFSDSEILEKVKFQEQYFSVKLVRK